MMRGVKRFPAVDGGDLNLLSSFADRVTPSRGGCSSTGFALGVRGLFSLAAAGRGLASSGFKSCCCAILDFNEYYQYFCLGTGLLFSVAADLSKRKALSHEGGVVGGGQGMERTQSIDLLQV